MEALPLTFYVDVDQGLTLNCEAYPEANNGQPCTERFLIGSDEPGENWCVIVNAIDHVFTHMPGWENTRL